jgi:hypothetical protein
MLVISLIFLVVIPVENVEDFRVNASNYGIALKKVLLPTFYPL